MAGFFTPEGFGDAAAGGLRNQVFGTTQQAAAAQQAALQQQATAQAQRTQAVDYAQKSADALKNLSAMSPQELQAYGGSLTAATANLAQQQKLLDAVNPALMEASKQVLNLMRGGPGASTPARDAQRAQLVNSLRAQYGPGAESTSVGQRALMQFDNNSGMMRNQDMQGLAGVFGIGSGISHDLVGGVGALSAAGQNFGNAQNRQINAQSTGASGVLGAMMGTGQQVINSAGADQTQQLIESGAQRSFWDNWSQSSMKFGESFGGFGMGKAGGGGGGSGGGVPADSPTSGWQPMSAQGNSYWRNNPYS